MAKPGLIGKEEKSQEVIVEGNEPVTQEKLELKMKEYIRVKAKTERIRLAVSVTKPFIEAHNQVVLKVSNPLQEDDVISAKNEIRNFLRKELNNSNVEVRTELIQVKTEKRMYTDSDRFNYLCKQNPVLGALKQKFSLDFE